MQTCPAGGDTKKLNLKKLIMNKNKVKTEKKLVVERKPVQVLQMPLWPKWRVEEFCGYVPKTTFWDDFWIGYMFGGEAGVRDTFKRAFAEWKDNVEYVTELVMVLNHLGDIWWEKSKRVARLFYGLFEEVYDWCREHLVGEDREYFYRVTD